MTDLSEIQKGGYVGAGAPQFGDVIGPAFEQESLIYRHYLEARQGHLFGMGFEDDPNYKPLLDPRIENRPEIWPEVWDVRSMPEMDYRLGLIDESNKNRNLLAAASPSTSAAAMTVAGMVNYDMAVPVAYAGSTIRRALKAAAYAASVSTLQEIGLSYYDRNRTATESALNIASVATVTGAVASFGSVAPHLKVGGLRGMFKSSAEGAKADLGDLAGAEARAAQPEAAADGSVGARYNPAAKTTLEDEGFISTPPRTEKTQLNPIVDIGQSATREGRILLEDLVEPGGIIKKKSLPFEQGGREEATGRSVELEFKLNYAKRLYDVINEQNRQFLKYKQFLQKGEGADLAAVDAYSDFGASFRARVFNNRSLKAFREEVGRAESSGEYPTPFHRAAAAKHRELLDYVATRAQEVGLFEKAYKHEVNSLKAEIAGLKEKGVKEADPAMAGRVAKAEKRLANLIQYGIEISPDSRHLARYYRLDRIANDPEGFIRGVVEGLREKTPELSVKEADAIARRTTARLSGYRPGIDVAEIKFKGTGDAHSARMRMLDIEDRFIEPYLERDIEVLTRRYVHTMGMDTELTRRFGDVGMTDALKKVAQEYDDLIQKAGAGTADATKLIREKQRVLDKFEALRDILRGTYGASKDPFAPTSRFIHAAKAFNAITMLGMASISSFGDVAKIAANEGFAQGYGPLLKSLQSGVRKQAMSMSRAELQAAGEGLDEIMGLRVMQLLDVGDEFGALTHAEQALQEGANVFFHLNGLNMWNAVIKQWASVPIANRIVSDSIAWTKGSISNIGKTKLLRHGIDEQTARIIAEESQKHGELINGVWHPNTAKWSEDATEALMSFRAALVQDVNRTIVTPGAGDKAVWTSTAFGGLITQFKTFGQASVNRTIISGMQEQQASFYTGMALMVGMGAVAVVLKQIIRGQDVDTDIKTLTAKAIDQSGILAVFGDALKSVEILTNNQMGLSPLISGGSGRTSYPSQVAGVFAGPTGSSIANITAVMGDILTGNADKQTARTIGNLLPGGNLPYIAPIRSGILNSLEPPAPGQNVDALAQKYRDMGYTDEQARRAAQDQLGQ